MEMVIEYILIATIAFTLGHNSGRQQKSCGHKDKVVVIHKHKKQKFPKWRKKHRYNRNGTIRFRYEIHDPYPIQDTPQQDTFNSQRPNN